MSRASGLIGFKQLDNTPSKTNREHLIASAFISVAATILLFGYAFVRNSSDTYFKAAYGPESLPVIMALLIPFLAITVHVYGIMLSHWGARRTLFSTNLIAAVLMIALYLADRSGVKLASAALYLVRECYVVLIIEQYWSFLNSTLSRHAAIKHYGWILGMSTIGPILGNVVIWQMATTWGYQTLLLIGAFSVFPSMFLADRAFQISGEPAHQPTARQSAMDQAGVRLLWQQPLLGCIGLTVFFSQVLSTVVSLNFQTQLYYALPDLNEQTAYSGGVHLILNSAAFLMQFAVVPLALRVSNLRTVHLFIPAAHICYACAAFVWPSVTIAAGAYVLFKALDYSLFRAAKEILYIPVSFDGRYRAKQVIDSFGYRFSKGGTSLAITTLSKGLGIGLTPWYPAIAGIAALFWGLTIKPMMRNHHALEKEMKAPIKNP